MKYIIIGAGIAGATAAETIRERDKEGEITLISGEPELVYYRVLLPSYVKGKIAREKLFVATAEQLAAKNIVVKSGVWAKAVDAQSRIVVLDNGETLSFDKLLIASGGRPRPWAVPGVDKAGVFHFQTIVDADAMLASLSAVNMAAIVGGGFIGLEFIEALTYRQIKTHLFLRGPYYWPEIMDEEQSERLVRKIEEMGVVVHRNETIAEVVGDDRVSAIKTESGTEVEVDFIGYGIGLARNLEFLEGSGVKTNRGVVTNEYLESSASGIFAAGDVAEFYDITLGKTHLVGNWGNAKKQGRVAGLNMAGVKTAYNDVSFYSMSVGGLFLAILGNTAAAEADETIVRKDEANYVKIFLSQNRAIGAAFVGGAREVMGIKRLITEKVILDERKKELLRDINNVIPA